MEYRTCGKSGLKLSVLGAGCWAYGGGQYWGAQDQKDVDAVVARALELGVNYFDTAEAYNDGASERSLGIALKGRRDRAIVGTKISPSNAYPGTLIEHCEASLRRLQSDYVDLYMIHWPIHPHSIRHFTKDQAVIDNPPRIADTLATLVRLKEQGKVRAIGVSNFGAARLHEAHRLCPDVCADELPYSLLTRAIEAEMIPCCASLNVGVIGYMTLLQGLLADLYPSLKEVPPWQRRTRHFSCRSCELARHGEEGAEDQTDRALADIREICRETGWTMPAIATTWAIANPGITCALVGARTVKELEANVRAVRDPLPADVVARLNGATEPLLAALGPGFDYYENTRDDRTL